MSSHREKDELSGVLDEIREYCAQKGLMVYRGWVSGERILKVKWTISKADDWRAFLDVAAALSLHVAYLDADRFDVGQIDDAKQKITGDADLEMALNEFETRIGQTFWFELGFFLGSVYHSYTQRAEWYLSFSDLTEKPEDSLTPRKIKADPELIQRLGELLAKHRRFPECRNSSQKMSLLMDMAGDDFEKLRPGAGIKKVIEKAEAYYFLNIQPQLEDKLRTEAQALRDQGVKLTQIARRLGVSRDRIRGLM